MPKHRSRLLARLALAITALGVLAVTLSLAQAEPSAQAQAALPFHQTAPLIASDSGQAPVLITATPGTPSTPTSTPTSTSTPTATPTPVNVCGSGHATLANFTDSGAATVARDPQAVDTRFLLTQTRPTIPASATRTGPIETTVYQLDVNLVSMTQTSDHAIHVTVADRTTGASFRVDFPGEGCIDSVGPDDHGQMFNARTEFRKACGNPPTSGDKALRGRATITGPGFWGSNAFLGAAPNGIEIGPVLGFEFTDTASCDPAHFTPTPEPTIPADWTYTVGVDVPRTQGVPPGAPAMALVNTYPAVPGITCTAVYASPPDEHGVIALLQLDPQVTGADGTATWHWTIPADSPLGLGSFNTHCGGKAANVIVNVTAAP